MEGKYEKTWITINLTYNTDGSHKLEPWFIGTAAMLCCFSQLFINIKNYCIIWRSNKKV